MGYNPKYNHEFRDGPHLDGYIVLPFNTISPSAILQVQVDSSFEVNLNGQNYEFEIEKAMSASLESFDQEAIDMAKATAASLELSVPVPTHRLSLCG